MSKPSDLGDLGFRIATVPYTTSTARAYVRTSDTGTVVTTGKTLDLSKHLAYSTTGGKPLDATLFPRPGGPKQFRSIAVAVPLELVFHSSGLYANVTVAHKHRSATSGAGSTWATIKSETKVFRMGTDTDATHHNGFVSSCNAQAIKRYYKANVTFAFKKSSSTAAADTTTGTEMVCNSPVYLLAGGDEFPAQNL
jgi:hypothetical protein